MRIFIAIRAGAAGLGFAVIAASSNASGAPALRPVPRLVRPAHVILHAGRPGRIRPAISNCQAALGSGAFIGGGFTNFAPGLDAAVLAGSFNQACDQASGIGTGNDNLVNGTGDSFIAAGDFNRISGLASFIGAGGSIFGLLNTINNTVSGQDSFLGAGDQNAVSGNGSFIGAGGSQAAQGLSSFGNSVYGNDAFLGAGDGNVVGALESFAGSGDSNQVVPGAGGSAGAAYGAIVAGTNNAISATTSSNAQSSFIGAGGFNAISGGASSIAAGNHNNVSGGSSSIGAGDGNSVAADDSWIGAGFGNSSSAVYSSIGAGYQNRALGAGSFVGAGGYQYLLGLAFNINVAGGSDSFVGAGDANLATALQSFIGAGQNNTVLGTGAFVGAGGDNIISLGGKYAAIAGGSKNTAGGLDAFVAGGNKNVANGRHSFAGGTGSQALASGSFVWSDAAPGAVTLKSKVTDQFLVRASGGVAFYSSGALSAGVKLSPGAGSWASLSDRASKTNIVALDPSDVLAKVEALPLSEWSYRSEDASIRHVGPMAQDFYDAFHVGEDNKHITTIDEDGIALAAIVGLAAEGKRKDLKVAALEAEVRRLIARDRKIEAAVGLLLDRSKSAIREGRSN